MTRARNLPLAAAIVVLLVAAASTAYERSRDVPDVSVRTTSGEIAWRNLEGQIAAETRLAATGQGMRQRAGVVDLLATRAQFGGRIGDLEEAQTLAETLVTEAPQDPHACLARAKARASFHRFDDARAELVRCRKLGAPPREGDALEASILQAVGRFPEALAIRKRMAAERSDVVAIGAEASVLADMGRMDDAERRFLDAKRAYRDVSPFPIAWIDYLRGLAWMREGDLVRAERLFAAAAERLPAYVAARAHHGIVRAMRTQGRDGLGEIEAVATRADDPDYGAELARLLAEAGRMDEAGPWRERARARFDMLLAAHPEGFYDHAAEFFLAAGADPPRALQLATKNCELRSTPRAYELMLHAAEAAADRRAQCSAVREAQSLPRVHPSLAARVRIAAPSCVS